MQDSWVSMVSSWSSKKDCRSYFKTLCLKEFAHDLVQHQKQMNQYLVGFLQDQTGIWGAYKATLGLEASVEIATESKHLRWIFPKMIQEQLSFYSPSGFVTGPFGILEPALGSTAIDLSEVSGLLIPGLSFNRNGNRLGKGKGFYDRALENFPGCKVGICFDFQISTEPLPTEPHDIRMNYIITESGLIDCRKYQE